MPSASRKPIQNWCVDQRLRTRGMPMRSAARAFFVSSALSRGFGATKGVFSNHLSSVWVGIFHALHALLHYAHLVDILEQAFRARVATDHALPARGKRHLAPGPAFRLGHAHIDERALATHRAPAAGGVLVRRARVL